MMNLTGTRNSRFRHKCLGITARRYDQLLEASLIGFIYETYTTSFRTVEQNQGILSLANVLSYAKEVAQPQDETEVIALSVLIGGTYDKPTAQLGAHQILGQVAEKLGVDVQVDGSLGLTIFSDAVKSILKWDDDKLYLTTEAESMTEFQPGVNPINN